MPDPLQTAVQALEDRFGAEKSDSHGQVRLMAAPGQIAEICLALRDEFGFEMLADLTAVDYWPQESSRFHLVYQFASLEHNIRLTLRVPLDGDEPSLSTVEGVYPNANWYERELFDMFGVTFEGHSDLRRLLMPHDWEGHPLRKDYPLGFEEVQFTFNYDEINQRKPKPKD